jgi:hypothetical protein
VLIGEGSYNVSPTSMVGSVSGTVHMRSSGRCWMAQMVAEEGCRRGGAHGGGNSGTMALRLFSATA